MRIWKQAKNSSAYDKVNVTHQKTKNSRRKRIEINCEQFWRIPLSRRTNIRSIACAMHMSKSTVQRKHKEGDFRKHTNPLKPHLKDSNKIARVRFCLSMIDKNSGGTPKFLDMFNMIHIDEKWFYITKKAEKFYLLPEENDPERTCKSKNFTTKVMFLTAIARPRFDANGYEVFSGKLGTFPFVTKQPAKRSSVNRMAGTLKTKPITSVGRIY